MRKLISLMISLSALTTVFVSTPVSAATSYTLKWTWSHDDRFLAKNESAVIRWATTPRSAPAPTASAPRSHPCTTSSYRGTFGVVWRANAERVTNNRPSQLCDVTLAATSNRSFRASPSIINRTYVVLSNEPIQALSGSWCVTSCVYEDGWTDAIMRSRASGQCYRTFYSPREGGSPNHGTAGIVRCPNRLTIDAPRSVKQGTRFNVKARSNLGIDVQISSATPSICKVMVTDTPLNHTVVGRSPGTCRVSATTRSNPLWQDPATVYDSTLITTCAPACPQLNYGPTAVADDFTFVYGARYSANVLTNDTGSGMLEATLVSGPDVGTVTLDASGGFVFTPPPLFVGATTFSYRATDAFGSDTTTVSLRVTPTPAPTPPTVTSGLKIITRAWMRQGVRESISIKASLSCDGVASTGAVCGVKPSAGQAVGAYVELVEVENPQFFLVAPTSYPASRYALLVNPATGANLTTSGSSGAARFDQATAANAPFVASARATATYRVVVWSNYNGNLQEQVTYRSSDVDARVSFGVTGATR